MTCSAFVKVNDTGGHDKRFVRTISDNVWVSVLFRLTGFGWSEWETAICTKEPPTCIIVIGDRRTELESLSEADVLVWRDAHQDEKNSLETLIGCIKTIALDKKEVENE